LSATTWLRRFPRTQAVCSCLSQLSNFLLQRSSPTCGGRLALHT
jgi:hypothetical protein